MENMLGKSKCENEPKTRSEFISDGLERVGYDGSGKEVLYCGKTGEPLKMPIFIGVVYYYRLKHMIADKQHARREGRRDLVTRQPVGGRGNMGGLRFGEMESHLLIDIGTPHILMDRFVVHSDGAKFAVCSQCNTFAIWPRKHNKALRPSCRICNTSDKVVVITLCHSMYLLINELSSVNIGLKLIVNKKNT